MSERITHVVPVGFEKDRAVHGFIHLGAHRIYLLIDEKGKDEKGINETEKNWGKLARNHAKEVKDRLYQMKFDKNKIIDVFFDPTDFVSSRDAVLEILEKEKDAQKVYLNISTSTKLCAVAFALTAIDYDNALLYYVVPEQYNLPPGGNPFSSGARRVEVFSPKVNIEFGEWEDKIMSALTTHKVSSLRDLNEILVPDDVSKAVRAKLSYYVRKLERKGYIDYKPGESIKLTELGRGLVVPPKDDAKIVSNR
jgi:hypothetical protein